MAILIQARITHIFGDVSQNVQNQEKLSRLFCARLNAGRAYISHSVSSASYRVWSRTGQNNDLV